MSNLPPVAPPNTRMKQRGAFDVSNKRGPGDTPQVPKHWGSDIPGGAGGPLETSNSVASERTTPGKILPPHPTSMPRGENGLDRALRSLHTVPDADSTSIEVTHGYDAPSSGMTSAEPPAAVTINTDVIGK